MLNPAFTKKDLIKLMKAGVAEEATMDQMTARDSWEGHG